MVKPSPTTAADHAVLDWSRAHPRLRPEVRFTCQRLRNEAVYVAEDLISRQYVQMGLPEYRFIRCLDGTRTPSEALAHSARIHGITALTSQDASGLLKWLLDHQFLELTSTGQAIRRDQHGTNHQPPLSWLSRIVFPKIPLGNPQEFLTRLSPWLGWTLSAPASLGWLILLLSAGWTLTGHWQVFAGAAAQAVLPANWFFLFLVYVGLKVIHEIWHGLATVRHGGTVPEWGIQLFALVTPLSYVDASSSWRFPSKRARMQVAFAGIYIELALAAVSVFVWAHTSSAFLGTLAWNTIFAASTITLLFNANPLMRFDGYFLVSEIAGVPNLATRGRQAAHWFCRRLLLGDSRPFPDQAGLRPVFVTVYGIMALAWQIIVMIGILALVAGLFRGIGLVLAALMLGGILMGLLKGLANLFRRGGIRPGRALPRLVLTLVLLGSALTLVKVHPGAKAVAVASHPEKAIVRVESPGLVREVNCAEGDRVFAGQILLRLENQELETQLERLRLDVRMSSQRVRLYLREKQLAAQQAEKKLFDGLVEKERILSQQVAALEVRAPRDGIIHGDSLADFPGRFLHAGDRVLMVIPPGPPEFLISASQEAAETLLRFPDSEVTVRLRGRPGEWHAHLHRVETRATTALPHPALASTAGGPLIVRRTAGSDSERERGLAIETTARSEQAHFAGADRREAQSQSSDELVDPRFYARATVSATGDYPLEGEWGYARFASAVGERLGPHLWRSLQDWIKNKIQKNTKPA